MKKKATLLKAALATIGVGCLAISVSPPYRIWRYDIAFQKIDVGSTAKEVVAQLGEPHTSMSVTEYRMGERFYIYSVHRLGPSGIWIIGFDSTGRVLSKRRVNNGC
jgi:hypothetical protein